MAINKEIATLVDQQLETFRQMLLRKRTFMLRKDYVHKEAFIEGSFKNLLIAYEFVCQTIRANYEK